MAFSPDGRTLAAAGVDAVSLWNVRTRQETRLSSRSSVEAIAFRPDGRTLAAARKDGPLELWNLRVPQSPPRRLSGIGAASAVAFSPDGGRLAVAHPTGEISLLDAREFRPLPVPLVGQTAAVRNIAFAPDGRALASASDDGTAVLWDARPELRANTLEGPGDSLVTAVDAADDGTIAAARGSDVLVWTKDGRASAPTIRGTGLLLDVALARNGKRLAAGSQDGEVLVAGLPGGRVRRLPPRDPTVPEPVLDVALNADGTKLAASLHNGTIVLEASNASALGTRLPGISDLSPFALALALSGDKLAAGRSDGTIAFWDAGSRRPIGKPFGSNEDQILSLDLSPDAKVLASVSGDEFVRLWDVDSRRALGEPLQAPASLVAVRFSPDGRLAAVGTDKGAVALFDVANRQLLGEPFVGHSGNVYSLAFTENGTGVVSGGADGRVLLWNVEFWADEDALRERACNLVGRNLTRSEWELYLPGRSYRRTCEQWPAGE